MKITFNRVYLANKDESVLSEWSSSVEVAGNELTQLSNDVFVLPPIQKQMKIDVNFEVTGDINDQSLITNVLTGLRRCESFWSDLNYKVSFEVRDRTISIVLECMIFTVMKVKSLLEQPLSLQNHRQYRLMTVDGISIDAYFITRKVGQYSDWSHILNQSNEYLVSLFISQLEFQFPLVFSRECRKRFIQQEKSLGPVSYALTSSSSLIPMFIKIICDDTTATTSYQVTKLLEDRRKLKRLQNNDHKPVPFEILKRFELIL